MSDNKRLWLYICDERKWEVAKDHHTIAVLHLMSEKTIFTVHRNKGRIFTVCLFGDGRHYVVKDIRTGVRDLLVWTNMYETPSDPFPDVPRDRAIILADDGIYHGSSERTEKAVKFQNRTYSLTTYTSDNVGQL